eukprot:2570535-Pyramimonas_sp.AAC.1
MPISVAALSLLTVKLALAKPICSAFPRSTRLVMMVDSSEITKPASAQPLAKGGPACKARPRALLHPPSTRWETLSTRDRVVTPGVPRAIGSGRLCSAHLEKPSVPPNPAIMPCSGSMASE